LSNQSSSQDLHNRGWGFALFILVLAVVVNIGVYVIHKATYLQPDAPKHTTESH
jgi:hypothetical protein